MVKNCTQRHEANRLLLLSQIREVVAGLSCSLSVRVLPFMEEVRGSLIKLERGKHAMLKFICFTPQGKIIRGIFTVLATKVRQNSISSLQANWGRVSKEFVVWLSHHTLTKIVFKIWLVSSF